MKIKNLFKKWIRRKYFQCNKNKEKFFEYKEQLQKYKSKYQNEQIIWSGNSQRNSKRQMNI